MNFFWFVVLGLFAGISSGALGIGGGLVMVPAMTYLLGYRQHLAQGTSLAVLILPVGLLGAWRYLKEGNINLPVVPWIALGFFLGAYLGADWIQKLDQTNLRRLFGACMLLVSLKMLWGK